MIRRLIVLLYKLYITGRSVQYQIVKYVGDELVEDTRFNRFWYTVHHLKYGIFEYLCVEYYRWFDKFKAQVEVIGVGGCFDEALKNDKFILHFTNYHFDRKAKYHAQYPPNNNATTPEPQPEQPQS